MDQPVEDFDLSPEQQETASLLQRLLGSAIANRYVDFSRLAAGALALNVSRPMAAHALRELDSMLRGVLEVPMEARAPETVEDVEKIARARKQLRELGFEGQVIDRAARELKPRLNHKQQIRRIVSRLGLAPDGDIANLWTSLTENFGAAHQRSFHRSLQVDDDFREKYQQPFDTVIRAVAVALQGRYVALMRRVEELAAMSDLMRARGFSYWMSRLDAARRSDNPDAFRAELGAIGQWAVRDRIDDHWLADQLLEMLRAGFVPADAFSVVDWLAKIALRNVDRAVEILSALLRNPRIDQWTYMTQQAPIRTVLAEGLARGTQETISKVNELIGFLSSINETGYIDLIQPRR